MLRWLELTRAMEERTVQLYRQGQIVGGCYTAIGNEGTSVGMALAMAEDDVLVPTHRDLGAHLVRGHAPLEVARQYLKRATSQTQGRDSGLHLGREGSRIVGMISHLAHMMPVAAGIALAERMKGTPVGVVTTVGDGSTSLGDFHETLNFAAVQKLPLVTVIVNNQYAYSTPTSLQYACERLSDRAQGYGMVGACVDGTDVAAVRAAVFEGLQRGRAGHGPTLLECRTMRMRGHSEHDDFAYVPPDLLQRWSRWDPVERARAALAQADVPSMELDRIRTEARDAVEGAYAQALDESAANPATAGQGVHRVWEPGWTVPSGADFELEDG